MRSQYQPSACINSGTNTRNNSLDLGFILQDLAWTDRAIEIHTHEYPSPFKGEVL
ncbi:MAG: hypothetical protein BWX66_01980 [Deltaproteobacteria bacterium ADurb.Bin058]|nr:MAG: hypothetical protein BWX66_01980 [Deltaproteobacteria bacterium ADurb.Bin058]